MPRLAKPTSTGPTLRDAVDAWSRSMRSSNKSPKTVSIYTFAVQRLADLVGEDRPINRITRSDHEALFDALRSKDWKPASISTVYRSLRSFWKFAVAHDDLPVERDPMNGMDAPSIPETTVKFVSDAELRAILATCQSRSRHNYLGIRDEAILRVLASTGARLSEIANLTLGDVDLVGATVKVVGKGSRERYLPLDESTLLAVKRYLDRERPRHPAALATDLVWLARAGAMTANGIAQAVAERGKAAGIKHRVHPHELRHRFIATVLGAGLSEGDTMALSGHRSRTMMDRYGRFTRSQRAHDAFRRATASGAIPKV